MLVHLQVILHYSDQGGGQYTTDPGYGKKKKRAGDRKYI